MLNGSTLLRQAAWHYDAVDVELAGAARNVWRGDFNAGAEWMRLAMSRVRGGKVPQGKANFRWLGVMKYLVAVAAGGSVAAAGWWWHPWCWLLLVPAFYAVEVQWVFLFPTALDGTPTPWRVSRMLMQRRAGTAAAMLVVLPLAWEMMTGGLRARGFVRSWCLGCLAVLLWYEQCLHPKDVVEKEEELLPLDLFHRAPLLLRKEKVPLAIPEQLRCLLVTDLHWTRGRQNRLETALDQTIERHRPHVVVLGGDVADTTEGLKGFAARTARWTRQAVVVAVPGNHDRFLGLQRVRSALMEAGVRWLPDGAFAVQQRGRTVLRVASLDAWPDEDGNDTPTVAVLHDPADFPAACARGAALALAGHLHGCQCVGWSHNGRLLPGAWFYRWNVLRYNESASRLIVSRGCADTLPVRWNCPREIVLCDLVPTTA